MDETIDFQSLVHEALGASARIMAKPTLLATRPSAQSWTVLTSCGAVVVRLGQPHAADAHRNRDSELAILALVSPQGLAPKALFMDASRGIMITECAPGRLWTPREARSHRNIVRITSLLRRLHALAIPPTAMTIDLDRVLVSHWNTLLGQGRGAQAGTAKTRSRIKKLSENFSTSGSRSVCHTAIHHSNVIDEAGNDELSDKGLMLIDWEYAGVCDPIFDLASLCCHHEFDTETRAVLMQEYFGTNNAAATKRLDNACVLLNYIRELWFAVREA